MAFVLLFYRQVATQQLVFVPNQNCDDEIKDRQNNHAEAVGVRKTVELVGHKDSKHGH